MAEEEDKADDQLKHYENGGFGAYAESHTGHRNPVRVILPEEPPALPPEAAQALLRIVREAYARRSHPIRTAPHPTQETSENDPDTPLE